MLFRGSKIIIGTHHEDKNMIPLQPKGGNAHHTLFYRSCFILVILISIFVWCGCSSSTTEPATAADVSKNTANTAEDKSKTESIVDLRDKNDALLHAAADGMAERVRAMIAQGADVNAKDSNGFSVLDVAVAFTQDEIVGILIEAGADVNLASDSGRTPLFYALSMGEREEADHEKAVLAIVNRLIAAKADVNYKDPRNVTVLELAAAQGYSTVIEALLAAGADVNAKDEKKYSALHIAASEHKLKALEVLLNAGADVNARSYNESTALGMAARGSYYQMSEACKPVEGVEGAYDCSMSQDKFADFSDGLKLLLDHGADPNLASKGGITPLMWVAWAGSLESVKVLLKAGADAKTLNQHHNTALHYAADCKGDEAICVSISKLLMDKGVDIHIQDGDGDTALIIAAKHQHKLLVKLFLDAGADPKVKNKKGQSAESFK